MKEIYKQEILETSKYDKNIGLLTNGNETYTFIKLFKRDMKIYIILMDKYSVYSKIIVLVLFKAFVIWNKNDCINCYFCESQFYYFEFLLIFN